jgi:hypothetical protein
MTQQEEQYVHFVSCIDSLELAWRILQEIKKSEAHPLIGVAFQFALIQYAKPYTTAYGITGRYKLDDRHVPSHRLNLHKRLIATRDQILAHADLTVMEAKLHVAQTSLGQRALIAQNVIHGAAELSNIDIIIELIEQTLTSMEVERRHLEGQLPLTMGAGPTDRE